METQGSSNGSSSSDTDPGAKTSQGSWQVFCSSRTKRRNSANQDSEAIKRVRNKATASATSSEIPLFNKFSELTPQESEGVLSTKQVVPPIILPDVVNVPEMTTCLNTAISQEEYQLKSLNNNKIKIIPASPEAYRKIIQHLSKSNYIYHTYQLKHERAYRVVLRNIHHSVDTDDIKLAINAYGHNVRNIHNIRHKYTKDPLPLFFIDLEPQSNNKEIFNINRLLNSVVKFEPPHMKKEIVQCKRCQRYEHTKAYCTYPFRCVKCGKNHESKLCPKEKETPPTCAQCDGNHPANYKGCIVYQEILKRKGINTPLRQNKSMFQETLTPLHQVQDNVNFNLHAPSSPIEISTSTKKTYAQAINANRISDPPQSNSNQQDVLSFLQFSFARFENILTQQAQQINSLLNMLTTLVSKLSNA